MSTLWILAVGIHLVVVGVHQGIVKSVTDTVPRASALAWQFGMAAAVVLLFGMVTGDLQPDLLGLGIAATGTVSFFGAYCQWRAYGYSLSRTSMLLPLVPLWAAFMAIVFLDERALYQETGLAVGILLLHMSAFLLAWQKRNKGSGAIELGWLLATLGAVFILGSTTFLIKVFADAVPHGMFLPHWYVGSFIGALSLLWYTKQPVLLPKKSLQRVFWASLTLVGSMAATFWALQLAPAGLVLPLESFGSALLPVLIGWFVFREMKGLSKYQWTGFALGLAGFAAVLMATL